MLPDIDLEECIEMLSTWIKTAMSYKEATGDFEYLFQAHRYNQIQKHLKAYQELLQKSGMDKLLDVFSEIRGDERHDNRRSKN